jgi:hypothetical protein
MAQSSASPDTVRYLENGFKADLSGKDAIVVAASPLNKDKRFNATVKDTRVLRIAGKDITFGPGSSLPAKFSNGGVVPGDFERVEIFADKLIIAQPLIVPGAEVHIFARTLEFQNEGRIDTTPSDWTIAGEEAAKGKAGADGLEGMKGGDIWLHCAAIMNPGEQVRFVAKGGAGQRPGIGYNGADGASMTTVPASVAADIFRSSNPNAADKPPSKEELKNLEGVVWLTKRKKTVHGSQGWPENGVDAQPAGIPGIGGRGGSVFLATDTFSNPDWFDLQGGKSAAKESNTVGGTPGTPIPAYWSDFSVTIEPAFSEFGSSSRFVEFKRIETHIARKGADAVSPEQQSVVGDKGSLRKDPVLQRWLHPACARVMLAVAKRASQEGDLPAALKVLEELQNLLKDPGSEKSPLVPEHEEEFASLAMETAAWHAKTAAGRDYYDNPRGWVPLLTLSKLASIYRQDVSDAAKSLYVSAWIGEAYEDVKHKAEALEEILQTLAKTEEELKRSMDNARNSMPDLKKQTDTLVAQNEALAKEVEAVNQRIEEQAKKKVISKERRQKLLGFVKAVASVAVSIPGASTAAKYVQFGARAVDTVTAPSTGPDEDSGLGTLAKLGGLYKDGVAVYDEQLKDAKERDGAAKAEKKKDDDLEAQRKAAVTDVKLLEDYNEKVKKRKEEKAAAARKTTVAIADGFLPAYKTYSDSRSLPPEQKATLMDKYTAELKDDPDYKNLIAKATEVSASMDAMGASLDAANKVLSEGAAAFEVNRKAMAIQSARLNQQQDLLVLDVKQWANELRAESLARLTKGRYLLAKAYGYTMLEPWTEPINVEMQFQQVEAMVKKNEASAKPKELTKEQLSDLLITYDAIIQDMRDALVQKLTVATDPVTVTIPYSPSETELKTLNSTQKLAVNLLGHLDSNDFNARVSDWRIKTLNIKGQDPKNADRITVNISPPTDGVLHGKKGSYRFNFGLGADQRPVLWGARCDTIQGNPFTTPIKPDTSLQDTLNSLLSAGSLTEKKSAVFAYAADGEFTIQLRKPAGSSIQITDLVIEVKVSVHKIQ